MSKKEEEVLEALRGIARGYGPKTGHTEIDSTRQALRVLAGHVVDALTERRWSMVQGSSMAALRTLAETAWHAREKNA